MKANHLHVVGLLLLERAPPILRQFLACRSVGYCSLRCCTKTTRCSWFSVPSVEGASPGWIFSPLQAFTGAPPPSAKHPPTTLSSVTPRVGRDLRLARTSSSFLQHHPLPFLPQIPNPHQPRLLSKRLFRPRFTPPHASLASLTGRRPKQVVFYRPYSAFALVSRVPHY